MLRQMFVAALVLAGGAQSALAQPTSITIPADPVPIVSAEINGRPVRFEVDLRFPSGIALSTAAAERLRVRRVPFVAILVVVLVFAVVFSDPPRILLLIFVTYAASGPVQYLLQLRRRKAVE